MKRICLMTVIIFTIATTQAQKAFDVKVTGKGQPVLFLPGFACTGELWDNTVKALANEYECHVFTFAGFGNVPAIDTPWLPTIRQQLVTYVREKGLKNTIVVGHSLGGTLGLWLAATETDLFKKIIAVDALPSTGALMVPNFNAATMVYNNPYSNQMLKMDSTAFRNMANQMAAGMMLKQEKVSQVVNWMMQCDRKTYVYGYIDLLKLDLREEVAKIKIPVVVLAATHPDKAMIEKTYQAQYAKLQQKRFEYADQSAHFIMNDQPEWLMTQLKANLK